MKKILCFLLFILPFTFFAMQVYSEPWGKDSHLVSKKKSLAPPKLSLMGLLFDHLITFHQNVTTSIGGSSHFRPTSSRYMQLAIYRYGFLKGFIMGCDRLLRENNEEWVYDRITIGNTSYKFDPAYENKKLPFVPPTDSLSQDKARRF